MAVRKKKAQVSAKSKGRSTKAGQTAAKPSGNWFKKYRGLIILFGAIWVVLLVLGNLLFFQENVPADFSVQLVKKITAMDSGSGSFQPGGLALVGDHMLAVTDNDSKRILLFDTDGKFIRFLGQDIPKPDRELMNTGKKQIPLDAFGGVAGLTSDETGHVFAMDVSAAMVKVFDTNGKLLDPVDLRNMWCYGPHGVTWDGKNFLIADTGSHRVLVVSRDSQLLETWGGKHGDGNGQFNNPCDVAADGKGHYAVADFDNNRVQILGAKGAFEKAIKVGGRPSGVAFLPDGRIIVASSEGGFVKVFKLNGKFVGSFKESKNQMTFTSFSSVRVAPDGLIYLAGNDTIVAVKPAP